MLLDLQTNVEYMHIKEHIHSSGEDEENIRGHTEGGTEKISSEDHAEKEKWITISNHLLKFKMLPNIIFYIKLSIDL